MSNSILEEILEYAEYQISLKHATPIGYDKIAKKAKEYLESGRRDNLGAVQAICSIAEMSVGCGQRGKQAYVEIVKIATEARKLESNSGKGRKIREPRVPGEPVVADDLG